MKLTLEMAEKHIGEYIDSYKRKPVSGYYPKQIIRFNGFLALKDPTGTCTKILDESSNYQDFDYFIHGRVEEVSEIERRWNCKTR
ncbi:MAG: hypothetical protein LUI12_05115 [Clostridiales bacterium]|nr:hypothetical protein [Clostridiales bacterium]